MKIDEEILNVFRSNPDDYISGQDLSRSIGISRAAIWKHIEKLREDGYEIEASPHLGYRLISVPDRLISSEIRWGLKTKILGREAISYEKAGSTNDIAYSLAERGLKEGTIVLAEEQTKGRGRLGRQWASPPGGGIYMSCILRPRLIPNEVSKITLAASVSVCKAIGQISGVSAAIRWPNDILINNRKVCGILTEMKAEQDTVNFVIVGIGVNVNTRLRSIPKGASSIREESKKIISRIGLTRAILEELEENYLVLKDKGFAPIVEKWKALASMLGSRVKIALHTREFEGQAIDVDVDGSLIVRLDNGFLERVSSGDVIIVR